MTDTASSTDKGLIRRFFGVPFRVQTYKNLVYLALGFPFGLVSFVTLTSGLTAGAGLSVTLIGIPILLATIAAGTALASVEAGLTRALVGVNASPPKAAAAVSNGTASDDDIMAAIKRFLAEPSTWTSLLVAFLWFIFGLVGFVALTTLSSLSLSMLGAPVLHLFAPGVDMMVGPYVVDTLSESAALTAVGIPLTLVSLHALNALAYAFGRITASLLNVGQTAEN
ncbi:hypothetical protein C499_02429 [Halogeometricum borinquense DSM 11551]|uniref:Putative sensor domain-containing protein n=2 Tax=Halogeometricum borinquense TaxID=60847 RepID=E4NPU3_HALBP|nr:sensor domain-containing protein [Halogeometricum borinquense]ADQ66576.1 hypothetical protein Hbor_09820 [Halogeometricum borinquense DSM 11551]ELY30684.1 hypothetical protein C499_02429 [Halogeometricum borinquense DSM 11551]RYJ14434.1 hypothetical protein ELS19_11025 [Halogeometricum borinquense]